MLGLQGIGREHVRAHGAARDPGDQVRDRPAAALQLEQVQHNRGDAVGDGGQVPGEPGQEQQPHHQPSAHRARPAPLLREQAALLPGRRLVPHRPGHQEHD